MRSTQDSAPNDYTALIEADRIHGSLYTSESVFADEVDRIFRRGWVYVCHESEIPAAGDFVRRRIGQDPVIAVRDRSGTINVLVNRCMHRANLICHESSGSARSLSCKYHGWTYDLTGRLVDVPYGEGLKKDRAELGLRRLPRVEAYRGFVFASFNENVIPLTEHLGKATEAIDRTVEMSPVGRIKLSGGWVTHRFRANWKMLVENDTDGYHVNFVHQSFLQAIRSNYDSSVLPDESALKSEALDWGQGHTEIDFAPSYTKRLEWFGCSEDRFPDYVKSMLAAYGEERGNRKLIEGPPHTIIFPNLFLAEMNIVIFEPISASETVHWHTPLLLEGVGDKVNERIMRQSEGALGPAAFLLADDAVIAERTQEALGLSGGWLDLSRGIDRESRDAKGIVRSNITDETTNRGFWHHYRKVMGGSRPRSTVRAA